MLWPVEREHPIKGEYFTKYYFLTAPLKCLASISFNFLACTCDIWKFPG